MAEGVTHYAPDGTMTEGDASMARWTVVDETHLQVVLADGLVDSASIGIAGDLFTPLVYDHFVDDGHVTFPEGDVILPEQVKQLFGSSRLNSSQSTEASILRLGRIP